MTEVFTQTEVCLLQIEPLLIAITEKTAGCTWINSRLNAQAHEWSHRLHTIHEKEQRFQELKSRIEASRSRLDAKRQPIEGKAQG
jgi:hypothetical protein